MRALDLSSCPYFRGEGQCQSGCFSEPSCITDRPLDGWPSERGVPGMGTPYPATERDEDSEYEYAREQALEDAK